MLDEAMEILRGLIEKVEIQPGEDGHEITLVDAIASSGEFRARSPLIELGRSGNQGALVVARHDQIES